MTGYSPEQRKAVGQAIRDGLADYRASGGKFQRRHPAEVTADRLGDDLEKYGVTLDGADRDAFARVRFILQCWGEGTQP